VENGIACRVFPTVAENGIAGRIFLVDFIKTTIQVKKESLSYIPDSSRKRDLLVVHSSR